MNEEKRGEKESAKREYEDRKEKGRQKEIKTSE